MPFPPQFEEEVHWKVSHDQDCCTILVIPLMWCSSIPTFLRVRALASGSWSSPRACTVVSLSQGQQWVGKWTCAGAQVALKPQTDRQTDRVCISCEVSIFRPWRESVPHLLLSLCYRDRKKHKTKTINKIQTKVKIFTWNTAQLVYF